MTYTKIPSIATESGPKNPKQFRFEKFHRDNPEVYTKLVAFAREVKAAGKTEYGIKDLFERLCWYYEIETSSHLLRLDRNFASFYAIVIAAQEPQLKSLL